MTTAGLASISSRAAAMRRAVESLLPQVDRVVVCLNGYEAVPGWMWGHLPKLTVHHFPPGEANPGDAGKFLALPGAAGYFLACDDDPEYGPGYAETMRAAVDRTGAVVTLQGKRLRRPLTSYYQDRAGFTKYSLQAPLWQDQPVDVPGTGVLCCRADLLRLTADDFPAVLPNVADLHVGAWCARRGVRIICAAHTGSEVRLSPLVDHCGPDTIWRQSHQDDARQTELTNAIYAIRARVVMI